MEYSEEVQKLAETLKNSGLAASMEDALKKAQSMLGKEEKKEEPFEKSKEEEKPADTAQTTLGDIKEPKKAVIEESPEEEEGLKKEDVFTTQKETKEEPNEKKVDYSKEKKIDLTDIFNVNK